jgi:glycosyltransferase involved in cell wall biosynthesis
MKICILGEFLSLASGHSKPAYELSVELIKLGIDVVFLTNELDKEIKRKHLQLLEKYPELEKVDFITIKKFRWSEFEKDKIMKKIENCDHFHFFTPSLSVINKFTDVFPDRVIWQITSDYLTIDELYKSGRYYADYLFYNPKKIGNLIFKYFYKFLGQKCKTVICTTKYMHARLQQLGFSTDNLKYIPFGVNLNPNVEKREIAIGEKFTYMYFGWLSPVRGITDLMYAFGETHSKLKESKLIIANPGDHYEEEAILRRLNNSDYMDRVQVLTWQENMNDTIKQADVVVLPFRGTFGYSQPPLVILEAMINSKPVISCNIGCINELIKNDETGLLIERGDIDGLVKAMLTLQDKRKCSDMGQKAFEKIQKNSWQNVIDKYLDLYKK